MDAIRDRERSSYDEYFSQKRTRAKCIGTNHGISNDDDTRSPRVKATATSFAILEAVRDRDGAGVTELARELDLAKSAVYKHLMTLTRLGYLVKEDTTYYLSLTFQGFGTRARERYPIYIAEPAIDNLAGTTGNVVNFMIYENGQGIYAYQARAPTAAEPPIPEYTHVPLHATAGGRQFWRISPPRSASEP